MARELKNNPLVVIVGPTASGKTSFAIQVAKKFNGEIICADSRTVYKEMNIGTAKPTLQEQAAACHYLLDVVKPSQAFTAADFKVLAQQAIEAIHSHGKLPILVGGTGLYIDAILFDYQFGKPADPNAKKRLENLKTEELQNLCREKNIEMPLNSQNRRHLIRAIELGGLLNHPKKLRPNTIVVGITIKKEVLRQRIIQRVEEMFKNGVAEEARRLGEKYGWRTEALTANIYRVLQEVLSGNKSIGQAKEAIVRSDVQLAKRQMTWFKRNRYIFWSEDQQKLTAQIEHFISQN